MLYSRADDLVIFGLVIACLPLVFSALVLFVSDGGRTLPYGPYPFLLYFGTLIFACYITTSSHDLDQAFNNSVLLEARVEKLVLVEHGLQKGNWAVVSSKTNPEAKAQTVELVCQPTPKLQEGQNIQLDISENGNVRQAGCSQLQQLGVSNIYQKWWIFLSVFMLIVVFARIEKGIFWGSKN